MMRQGTLSRVVVTMMALFFCFRHPVLAQDPLFESDFERTASGGFDDPQNNYAFSSTILGDCMYVGTGRNFLFRLFDATGQADQIEFITKPGRDAWSLERAIDNSAEIWHRCKSNDDWERVYMSGQTDVSFLPVPNLPKPAYAADEPGFRSMTTFQGSCSQECIYAASFASAVPGRLLIRSCDGETWEDVVTLPTIMETDSRSILAHEGKLYVGTFNFFMPTARLWVSDCPGTSSWSEAADFTTAGTAGNVAVVSMASWKDFLYVGTQNDDSGFQVWKSTVTHPTSISDFTQIIDEGAGDQASTCALTMTVFKNWLIVGTSMFPLATAPPFLLPPKGFEVIHVNNDDSWDLMVGDYFAQKPPGGTPVLHLPKSGWPGGFMNFLALYAWSLQAHDGYLYLGTFDTTTFLALLPELLSGDTTSLPNSPILFQEEQQRVAIEEGVYQMGVAIEQRCLMLDQLPQSHRTLIHLLGDFCDIDWYCVFEFIIEELAGTDLWRMADLVNWEPVTLNGFDNPTNYGIRTTQSFDGLQVGTANPFEGLEMLKAESSSKSRSKSKSKGGQDLKKCVKSKGSKGKRCKK